MPPCEIIIKNKRIEEKANLSDYAIPLSDRLSGALTCAADAGWWMFRAYLKLLALGLVITVPFIVAILQVARKANRRTRW